MHRYLAECLASRFISFSASHAVVQFCPSSLLEVLTLDFQSSSFWKDLGTCMQISFLTVHSQAQTPQSGYVDQMPIPVSQRTLMRKSSSQRDKNSQTNKQKILSPTTPLPVSWLFAARTDSLGFYVFKESLEVSAHCHSSRSALCSLCRLQQPH